MAAAAVALPTAAAPELITRGHPAALEGLGDAPSFVTGRRIGANSAVFQTFATNLVNGDTNFAADVLMRFASFSGTRRISVRPDGSEFDEATGDAALSSLGFAVAFVASHNEDGLPFTVSRVFVRNLNGFTTHEVSLPIGAPGASRQSRHPDVAETAQGLVVAFETRDVIDGDDNGFFDIYAWHQDGHYERISARPDGGVANGHSTWPWITGNGRHVVFLSTATDLVAPSLPGGVTRVFVRDRVAGTTTGLFANGEAIATMSPPSISFDGRFVAFLSDRSDLVAGDTNGLVDGFRYDLVTHEIIRITTDGATEADRPIESLALSSGGNCAVFTTQATTFPGAAPLVRHVYTKRIDAGTLSLASRSLTDVAANRSSQAEVVASDDCNAVGFSTGASNLAIDTNDEIDAYVRRESPPGPLLISRRDNGQGAGYLPAQANGSSFVGAKAISDDGRFVVFMSDANNLVVSDINGDFDVFLHDRVNGTTTRVSGHNQVFYGSSYGGSISPDGQVIAFFARASNFSTGATGDVLVTTVRGSNVLVAGPVARDTAGSGVFRTDYAVSDDTGRYWVFQDGASPPHLLLHDRIAQTTTPIGGASPGATGVDGIARAGDLSGNGNLLAFTSRATWLVPGEPLPGAFLRDTATGALTRLTATVPVDGGVAMPSAASWIARIMDNTSPGSPCTGVGRGVAIQPVAGGAQTCITTPLAVATVDDQVNHVSVSRNGTWAAVTASFPTCGMSACNRAYRIRTSDGAFDLASAGEAGVSSTRNGGVVAVASAGQVVFDSTQRLSRDDPNDHVDVYINFAPPLDVPFSNGFE